MNYKPRKTAQWRSNADYVNGVITEQGISTDDKTYEKLRCTKYKHVRIRIHARTFFRDYTELWPMKKSLRKHCPHLLGRTIWAEQGFQLGSTIEILPDKNFHQQNVIWNPKPTNANKSTLMPNPGGLRFPLWSNSRHKIKLFLFQTQCTRTSNKTTRDESFTNHTSPTKWGGDATEHCARRTAWSPSWQGRAESPTPGDSTPLSSHLHDQFFSSRNWWWPSELAQKSEPRNTKTNPKLFFNQPSN